MPRHSHPVPAASMVLEEQQLDELDLILGGLAGTPASYALPSSTTGPSLWPPALLVPQALAGGLTNSSELHLTDPDGTPLAAVTIAQTCPASTSAGVFVAGRVTALQPAEHPPFRHLRVKAPLGPSTLVAAFSRPPHPDQIKMVAHAARRYASSVLLLAVQDSDGSRHRGFDRLVEVLELCAASMPAGEVGVLVIPGFLTPDAANGKTRVQSTLQNLGAAHVLDFCCPADQDDEHRAAHRSTGAVVLFTGLSGSGKSTLARALAEQLHQLDDRAVTLLDGDEVRRFLSAGLGFSRADRETNVERIGWVAALIAKSSGIAICAPIAPFESTRQRVRELASSAGRFVLVHVSTPLDICEARDRKGLYAKARAGLLPDFTGIGSPYEQPLNADLEIDTSATSVDEATSQIISILYRDLAS